MTRRATCVTVTAIVLMAAVPAHAESPLERGTYLMRAVVACGNCHTPKGPEGDIADMELAGMAPFYSQPGFDANSANITPDVDTGIGGWTDAQIATAIREGHRPDGSLIGPPMPIPLYSRMSDSDVAAIIAYLRQVRPIENRIPPSRYDVALPERYGPPVTSVPDVPRDDPVAYGEYLAGPLAHCVECHSPLGPDGAPDIEHQLGAGGQEIPGPWGLAVTANLTPTGLADRTDDEIKQMITSGIRPDGSPMSPPMPYGYYAGMSEADLDAIVAYLRSLPPL